MDSNTTTKLKCLLALYVAVILAIAVLSLCADLIHISTSTVLFKIFNSL
jgi:hypothetical protein